ncbi:hypothetical protein BDV93DRAFT_546646, partial [Ceratobasidium sp. AG-I]
MSYTNPAAKIAQVCLRWRQAALETGPLWSCVSLSYETRGDYERVLTNAWTQLERTRGSSVDLFLSHDSAYVMDVFQFRLILDVIKPYLQQLRSLTLRLSTSEDVESLLECCLINGIVGSLSRLEILGGNMSYYLFRQAGSQTHQQLDEYLRSVRVLRLRNVAFGWESAVLGHLDELVLQGLAIVNDLEAPKVKEWRHTLQRAFLSRTSPAPEEMAGLDALFTTVERYDKMDVDRLAYSKIDKSMRKIAKLTNIPSDDQYQFRQRAEALTTRWQQLTNASQSPAFLDPYRRTPRGRFVNPDKIQNEDALPELEREESTDGRGRWGGS